MILEIFLEIHSVHAVLPRTIAVEIITRTQQFDYKKLKLLVDDTNILYLIRSAPL